MVRMKSDLLPVLAAAARGELAEETSIAWGEAAVCVVLASGGYPRDYATGKRISGLDDLGPDAGAGDLVVFHAGTRRPADGIGFETAGGRVLGVTARGDSVAEACDRAYRAVAKIGFEGRHFRRDIAARALRR
jgi:phosphoribosylamine--glycine ligase